MKSASNPYRLARTVVPSAYRIALTPDLEAFTFSGSVEIDVDITETVREITLNAVELELGAATVSDEGTSYRSLEHRFDEAYETVTFVFDRDLPPGRAVMEIDFDGVLNDRLHGFYRSTFTDDDGVAHTIATTQFENTDARRAFPCFDEPSFKATYEVTLTVPTAAKAYSNSPVVSDVEQGNGRRTVRFAPTMKMSTYLVAFIVGDFEESPTVDVDGVPLRVIAPVGKSHLSELALEAGAFALRFFSEYFNIPYPGDKLDLVGIPDFTQGAMENLGCITFREVDLLMDSANASFAEKKRITEVIAHEIAHMWFGDLVTMEWWEGIWLNEAFATFMQVSCANAFRPQWKMWVHFGILRDIALQIDGLHTTRPIEYEVVSPDDTRGMFDVLTYEKGGSCLRMLEQYLGAETFRDGIRHYLTKHSYANTVTTDLWDALEEVSQQPVRNIMNTWILQGGLPLVTLANGELTQQPFSYGKASGESSIGSTWMIPVLTRSLKGGEVSKHLLLETPESVSEPAPVLLNAGGSGVYRSRYGRVELDAITDHLDELDELERSILVADGWALLLSGRIPFGDFTSIAKGLGDEDDPTSWGTIWQAFDYVSRALDDEKRERFVEEVRAIFYPQFTRLGWDRVEGENELASQMRAIVLRVLGNIVEDDAVRAEAVRRFEANQLDADIAGAILAIVAAQDRPGDYERFLERYRQAATPQEEMRVLRFGLPAFREERVALDAAEKCFSEFRTQDASPEFALLTSNAWTGPAVWRYLTGRWDDALSMFPLNTLYYLTHGVATFIKDEAFAETVEKFHTEHPLEGMQRMVEQDLERMRVGVAFASTMRQQF